MSQNYTPTKWIEDTTVGTASVMNNIEKGIENAHDRIDSVDSQIKDIENGLRLVADGNIVRLMLGDVELSSITIQGTGTGGSDEGAGIEPVELLASSLCFYEPTDVPNTWATDSTGKILDVNTEAFYDLFYNPYVGTISGYGTVTKTQLGLDQSGTYPLYEYDFKPTNYNRTILLTSGMHPYELSAHFGCAWLIKSIMEKYNDNTMLKYLHDNVRIKIIPIVNPWGWNQSPKKYGNVNGVNINRNFDYQDESGNSVWEQFPVYSSNPSDSNYNEWNVKGENPFSEAESQILRDWALGNKDVAEFWIDCHTGLGLGPWDNFIYYSNDSTLVDRITKSLARLEGRIKNKYNTTPTKEVRIDVIDSIRLRWSEKVAGVPGMTVEQTPNNPKWGTSINNESGDIANYCTTLLSYIMEFLVTTYDGVYSVNQTLTNVSTTNYHIEVGDGKTYTTTLSPISSSYTLGDVSVIMGDVNITANAYNSKTGKITINNVTGNIYITAIASTSEDSAIELNMEIGAINYEGDGENTDSTTRVRTSGYLDCSAGTSITVDLSNCPFNQFVYRQYDSNFKFVKAGSNWQNSKTSFDAIGNYYRLVFRKSNDSKITSDMINGNITINNTIYKLTNNTVTRYTVTNNLSNVTNSNSLTSIQENAQYSATITPNIYYALDSVTVTMGGIDITDSAYSNGTILIEAVTGDIVITASASYVEVGIDGHCLADVNLANGNTTDTSGKHNNATLSGTYTTDSEGIVFTGESGMIDTGLKLSQGANIAFTLKIEFLFTDISSNTSGYLFGQGDFSNGNTLLAQASASSFSVKVVQGTTNNIFEFGNTNSSETPKFNIVANTKYELCLTYDGTTIKCYIDKELKKSKQCFISLQDMNLILGNRIDSIRGMKGRIYSYKIYDVALTNEEIQSI